MQLQHISLSRLGKSCPRATRARRVVPAQSRGRLQCHALHIDRRAGFEESWRRQQEKEQRAATLDLTHGSNGEVFEVRDLSDLEMVADKAGSNLVILFFYSKTCGVCKDARRRFEVMCQDAARSRARVVFCSADVHDEYDHTSDVARWHKVRVVPTFLFLDEGAVVKRLSLRDVRGLSAEGGPDWIQAALAEDMRRLKSTFTEVMLRRAPSAR
mmetsp:Transcript_2968/g.7287  ORF Transcript_2968/g.7287 Transcript_2968/m.7287 type:complete len:213 (-) Transcript_2968:831-1469(-)